MRRLSIAVVAFVLLAGGAVAQPPIPAPGPEQAIFKMDEGVWDASIELTPPGAPSMTSTGVETNTIGCGGMCLITDFKADLMPGMPFHDHGITSPDGKATQNMRVTYTRRK